MSLSKFGKHSSSMTIDKFGKHVHGHNIAAHFNKRENLQRYFKQPTILTFSGDGTTDTTDNYYIIQNLGYVSKYINFLYIGEIVKYRFEGDVEMIINGSIFDPNKKLNVLFFGDKIVCKPTTKTTLLKKPFMVELLIEISRK